MRRVAPLFAVAAMVLAGVPASTLGHPADSAVDQDHDGVHNSQDNCIDAGNADQRDTDLDGAGDACDPDDDGDEAADEVDNCPVKPNATQSDLDSDGRGDTCDPDVDGDAVSNGADNCPRAANAAQEDADGDAIGDACDSTPRRPGGSDTTGGGGAGGAPQTGDDRAGGVVVGSDPRDTVPPRATIRAGGVHELGALRLGLPVPVRCPEACAISGLLELDRSAARRLGLSGADATVPIGSGAARLAGPGETFVIIRFNPAALRRLASVKATRPRLRVIVADAADNRKILYRRLALKR